MNTATTYRIIVAMAVAAMVGCAGSSDTTGAYPNQPTNPNTPGQTQNGLAAVCKVNVTGGTITTAAGQKDVETEYLPRVLWCSAGQLQASAEFLRARAVAARTYVYRKVQTSGSITNTPQDQLYMAASCQGTIPSEYLDAVTQTSQMVMVDATTSQLASGVVYAGQANACQKAANCNGVPCMGQAEAAACASSGYDWRTILKMFFDSPNIMRAEGTCGGTQAPPGTSNNYGTCSYNGKAGNCQPNHLTCSGGTYVGGLCGSQPANIQCCVPNGSTPGTSQGSCSYNGHTGTCQTQSTPCLNGAGKYWDKLCTNAAAGVYCCLPANAMTTPGPGTTTPTTQYGNCYSAGKQGTCKKQAEGCTNGKFYGGLCNNVPTDVFCCLPNDATPAPPPTTTTYGNCNKSPYTAYKCQDSTKQSCSGTLEYKSGYCTQYSSSAVKCCAPKSTTTTPPPPTTLGNCNKSPYTAYKCQDSTKQTCSGTMEYKSGYCTQYSSSTIKCCAPKSTTTTPPPTTLGNCNKAPYTQYQCKEASQCTGSYKPVSGYCTQYSSSSIQCCIPSGTTSTGGGSGDEQYIGNLCSGGKGVCRWNQPGMCPSPSTFVDGACPGTSAVKCCVGDTQVTELMPPWTPDGMSQA